MTSNRRLWIVLAAALVTVPGLYLASFGPACWAVDQGLIREQLVRIAYGRLIAAIQEYSSAAPSQALKKWAGVYGPCQRPFWYFDGVTATSGHLRKK